MRDLLAQHLIANYKYKIVIQSQAAKKQGTVDESGFLEASNISLIPLFPQKNHFKRVRARYTVF